MGAGEAFVAGGTESMSRVPMMGFNLLPHPAWTEQQVLDFVNVGQTAERVADQYGLTRADQEAFAFASQLKARNAQKDGSLAAEIAPVPVGDALVSQDGCVRGTSLEKLAELKPAFKADGTVTADTSSPMTDGATAVLVRGEGYLEKRGVTPLAKIKSYAVSDCAPGGMDLGPIESSRKALARAGLSIGDIDIVEMNEAFTSQSEACRPELNISHEKLNIDGGAIALGHEAGARGGDFARASPRDLRPDRAYARHWKALAQLRKP
jgi:acetyl-CoA acyltransferase